jgi:trk system potassium uptake protein
MKIMIMGCGRVGGRLATMLDQQGHAVTVIDIDSYSFRRLPANFRGKALVGNGNDAEALKRAGIEGTDVFLALTQGDNRNIMAAQIAKHIYNVKRVICRIYDPLRQEMYEGLGLESISPTAIVADILKKKIEDQG